MLQVQKCVLNPKTPPLLAQLAVTQKRLPLMSQIDTDNLSISVLTPASQILLNAERLLMQNEYISDICWRSVLITIVFVSHIGCSLSNRSMRMTQAHLHISGALLCDLESLKAKCEAGGWAQKLGLFAICMGSLLGDSTVQYRVLLEVHGQCTVQHTIYVRGPRVKIIIRS